MSSIPSTPLTPWGALGAPDWRHAPAADAQAVTAQGLSIDATPGAGWFAGAAPASPASLSADVGPSARGLSVAQHATRVLAALCG